jgi:hypothetical protein
MGLHAILPILDSVHILIKCAQSFNLFVHNFINVMKICQFYNDPYNKFDNLAFDELNALETFIIKNMLMS